MRILGPFIARKRRYQPVEPDEILIDAANLPQFDTARLEGRIERPIASKTYRNFLALVGLIGLVASGQLLNLQVFRFDAFSARAEENRLAHTTIISERGLLLDRNGFVLTQNAPSLEAGLATRAYTLGESAAHVVGYVSYPKRDQNGFWYQDQAEGIAGLEQIFDKKLAGTNGITIAETDAAGHEVSGSIVREPDSGADIRTSLDAGVQKALFEAIRRNAEKYGWRGGAGVIMDIKTGEIIALSSYPSFDPEIVSSGESHDAIALLLSDPRSPFLDRAIAGLYATGSVVKPFIAVAALQEKIITPEKKILSTGSISVPNPYYPDKPSIFKDWKAHGWVDMREALSVSSDVYFYEIGGGFENQKGLGISTIERYLRLFGFAAPSGIPLLGEETGVIPNPEWKATNFDGEQWYLGDTYHTSIGQYGFQATLMQLVRAVAAVANDGILVTPVMEAGERGAQTPLPLEAPNLQIIREGMRLGVTTGTVLPLSMSEVAVGAKTGTAQVGVRNEYINSLVEGFFPFDNPRYAFALVLERAKTGTPQNSAAVAMRETLEWIAANRPEMVQ